MVPPMYGTDSAWRVGPYSIFPTSTGKRFWSYGTTLPVLVGKSEAAGFSTGRSLLLFNRFVSISEPTLVIHLQEILGAGIANYKCFSSMTNLLYQKLLL